MSIGRYKSDLKSHHWRVLECRAASRNVQKMITGPEHHPGPMVGLKIQFLPRLIPGYSNNVLIIFRAVTQW